MTQDLIKKKVIYSRTTAPDYSSQVVEFPIGIGEAVRLIAVHWSLEAMADSPASRLFVAALSENPDHELNPPVGVAEFMSDLSLYAMVTFIQYFVGIGTDHGYGVNDHTLVIPLYGILRPKRQVVVLANIWAGTIVGIRGEIYYTEEKVSREIIDAISRRSGKYRRT